MNNFYRLAIAALFLFTVVTGTSLAVQKDTGTSVALIPTIQNKEPVPVVMAPNPFGSLSLEAKAAVVLDGRTGKLLYAKNAETQLPLASLTKLMTATVAQDILSENTTITIPPRATAIDPGIQSGKKWQLKDLLNFTLTASSNGGAAALASAAESVLTARSGGDVLDNPEPAAFIAQMNKKAKDIGLKQTFYLGETGLDASANTAGSVGSAHDMATLLDYLILRRPDLLDATTKPSIATAPAGEAPKKINNTDLALPAIPVLLGGKTGLTDLAGGNLAVAFDAGIQQPIVVVVLGSSEEGRFEDIKKLVAATIACIDMNCTPLETL